MADLSRKTASIYINHTAAEDALKALQKQADVLQEKIKKGEAAGKNMVNEIQKLNKVKNDMAGIQKQIDSGLRPSFNQLQSQVAKLRNELNRMSQDAPGYAAKFQAYQQASKELERLRQSINGVQNESKGLNSVFSDFAKGAFFGGGMLQAINIAADAVKQFLSGAIDEAMQADEASARLQGTLDNLGQSSAFDRITAQSDRLAQSLTYLDNDDINGVFEQLITYGKLTEAQMSRLVPVILDFAAKSRQSLPEAASVILKALEGNGKALKEYGINIKDAETDTERFAVVMDQLGPKVEGAAATFRDSMAGSVASARQEVKNAQEDIGNKLAPAYAGLLQILSGSLSGYIDYVKTAVKIYSLGLIDLFKEPSKDEKLKNSMKEFANSISVESSKKPLEEQQKLVQSYYAILLKSQKEFNDLKSKGVTADEKELNKLYNQLRQDTAIYTAVKKAYDDSKAQADRIAADKAKEEADKKAEEAKKAAEKARKQYKEEKEKLEELKKAIQDTYDKTFMSEFIYEHNKIFEQYDQEVEKLNKLHATRKELNEYTSKLDEIRAKKQQELFEKYYGASNPITPQKVEIPSNINNNTFKNYIDKQYKELDNLIKSKEKDLQYSTGKTRLSIQLDILELQRKQELMNTELTEQQRAEIQKKYDQQRQQAIINTYVAQAEKVVQAGQFYADLLTQQNAAKAAEDQEQLNKIDMRAQKEKDNAKNLLDKKLIDQQEYDRRVKAADKKKEEEEIKIKKRQFEREKKLELVKAGINGIQSVLTTLKEFGPPIPPNIEGIMAMGFTLATVAANISAISKKKFEYGRGGYLNGPSHQNGGMPVINPVTGQKEAEVEGGEVILSKQTVKNNGALVAQLLNSSMYNNGARITPFWQTRPAYVVNYGAITKSIESNRKFERGGVFQSDNENFNTAQFDAINQTLASLNERLNQPMQAYVVLSNINAAQEMNDQIKSDAAMKRTA